MSQNKLSQTAERYDDLRAEVNRRFPPGRFVAADAGGIVADAESHAALVARLQALGRSPKDMVILEAGADYPEYVTIL